MYQLMIKAAAKVLIPVGITASVMSIGWYMDRTAQYKKGEQHCQEAQLRAQADYWETRAARIAEEGKSALLKEQTAGNKIRDLSDLRKREVEREAQKPVADSCLYSDDELRELEELIRQTGT